MDILSTKLIARTVLGLYIHDVMLASMFHHEPLLRHDAIMVSVAADDSLFNAPTAATWRDQLRIQPPSKPSVHECIHVNQHPHHYTQQVAAELLCGQSRFTAYVMLHGIYASVCEKQQIGHLAPSSPNFTKYCDALMCWYFTFEIQRSVHNARDTPQSDSFCLMILWHTIFMNLLADFNTLERAIGRDGLDNTSTDPDHVYALQWAASPEARRCILHAYALESTLGTMRLDTEPAIHIPHCLFLAGIASYCYSRFRRMSSQDASPEQEFSFPEFHLPGVGVPHYHLGPPSASTNLHSRTDRSDGNRNGQHGEQGRQSSDLAVPLGASMLCTLTDMLQRIGHWGIARKFACILGTLSQADMDEDWMLM